MKKVILVLGVVLLLSLGCLAQQQHGLNLTWTLSPTPGVTSQLVCRSVTSGTENCATPLATLANDTTISYLDTTGVGGTKYFYTLEACITIGTTTFCSPPTAEVNAVFPIIPAPQSSVSVSIQ